MKKLTPLALVFVLILSSLACNLGARPQTAPTPVETDACCTNEPEVPLEQPAPTQPPAAAEEPSAPAGPQASGLQPGWYAFTNANVVRDLVIYKGVIHAATLGGLITWRLDSGYSMRYTPLDGMGLNANWIVKMPGKVIESNATEQDGSTLTWKLQIAKENNIRAVSKVGGAGLGLGGDWIAYVLGGGVFLCLCCFIPLVIGGGAGFYFWRKKKAAGTEPSAEIPAA